MRIRAHDHLRFRVFAGDAAHVPASAGFGQAVFSAARFHREDVTPK